MSNQRPPGFCFCLPGAGAAPTGWGETPADSSPPLLLAPTTPSCSPPRFAGARGVPPTLSLRGAGYSPAALQAGHHRGPGCLQDRISPVAVPSGSPCCCDVGTRQQKAVSYSHEVQTHPCRQVLEGGWVVRKCLVHTVAQSSSMWNVQGRPPWVLISNQQTEREGVIHEWVPSTGLKIASVPSAHVSLVDLGHMITSICKGV